MARHNVFDAVSFPVPPELTRDAPHDVLAAELRPHAERCLDGDPGYFVLTGLGHLDLEGHRAFALAASAALGELLPQDGAGTLLREVRYRGVELGEGSTGRYSDSRTGGNLHTDSPHRPGPVPDYFALSCVHQAAVGGDLVLVRLADIVERLASRPDVLETLRTPVHFDTRDDTPGVPRTVLRPVLDSRNGSDRVHYLREYIDIGHRQPGIQPLTPEQVHALDTLDALLDSPELRSQGRLQEGEMIFIDNRWTLHGRVEFRDLDGGHQRLMLRTWIAAQDS
ncbi:TauD/TfdA family dioxygenase [Streptomyces sp. NPDC127084]|uniref:TauD/TfdA family dioxygenase n=1 Tax=Streptomyces sp. NPDC127084 TaxID=3347133 RepID=UPI003647ECE5